MTTKALEILGILAVAASIGLAGSSHVAYSQSDDAIKPRVKTWVGAHVDDLIEKWGDPAEKRRDGRGGWTFVYLVAPVGSPSPAIVATNQLDGGPPTQYVPGPGPYSDLPRSTEAVFYIGKDDRVYEYWLAPWAYERFARQRLTMPTAGSELPKEPWPETSGAGGQPPPPEWKLAGQVGTTMFVYVSPSGMGDERFVAGVLGSLVRENGEAKPITVMIFDDEMFTPRDLPLTDAQRFHQKAEYSFDPDADTERFVWLSITDPFGSPVEFVEHEAGISADLDG